VINTQVGPFLILKKLGNNRRQGVYHARQIEQNRDVALKFVSIPADVSFATALERFELEVSELQKLKHPNLVRVYGAGVHEEKVFFASELIEGESLAALLARRGKLAPDLVVEYGKQIAELLLYLHNRELIHSKLTPDKILIQPDNTVKVADLRLNRSRRRRWDSEQHRELDRAAYLAPEQSSEGATEKTDMYSLGVILFEMLTGKLPYEPDTIGRMAKMKLNAPVPSVADHLMNCPIWLDRIVSQMLQPVPRQRPHSTKAIVLAFEEMKKMDASQTAAVDQVASGFNALNAHNSRADKTEARKLLGHNKNRSNQTDTRFFQSIPFMVFSLILVIGFSVFMLLPKSINAQMQEAEKLLTSDNDDDWKDARQILLPIMEGNSPQAVVAEQLYFESRRKSLVRLAEKGLSNKLQSENVRRFGRAVSFQQADRFEEAFEEFKKLEQTLTSQKAKPQSPIEDERYILDEVKARLTSLTKKKKQGQAAAIPRDPKLLLQLVRGASLAESYEDLTIANEQLSKILIEFAGEPDYEEVITAVRNLHPGVKQKLATHTELRKTKP